MAGDGGWRVKLRLVDSDYDDALVDKDGKPVLPKAQQSPVTPTSDSSIRIDKVIYKEFKHG